MFEMSRHFDFHAGTPRYQLLSEELEEEVTLDISTVGATVVDRCRCRCRRSSSPFGWGLLMDWFKGKSAENPHLIGLLSGSIYRQKNDEKKHGFLQPIE